MWFIQNEAMQVALLGAIVLGEFGVFAYYTFRTEDSELADAWLRIRAVSHCFSLVYYLLRVVLGHALKGMLAESLAQQIQFVLSGGVVLSYLAYAAFRIRERGRATASLNSWCRDEFTGISVVISVFLAVAELCVYAVWYSDSIVPLACVSAALFIGGVAYIYFSTERKSERQRRRNEQRWTGRERREKAELPENRPSAQTQVPQPNQPTRRNIINPFINPRRTPIPIGPTASGRKKPDPPKPVEKEPRPEDAPPMVIQGSDFRLTKPEVVSLELITENDRLPLYCRGLGSLNELDIVVWWPVEKMKYWMGNEVLVLVSVDVRPDPIMRIVVINFRDNSQIVIPQPTSAKLPDTTAM